MTTIEHQGALARIEDMRRYTDDPAASWAEETTPLPAPATSRPGDGRLQSASLNRRPCGDGEASRPAPGLADS
jgi:hypothetical protein